MPIPTKTVSLGAALASVLLSCVSPGASDGPPPQNAAMDALPNLVAPDHAVNAQPLAQTSFAALGKAPITDAALHYQSDTGALEAAPPLSLTAADGTGLQLSQLDARAVIEGPLAFTELHLRFENPLNRTIEGRFAITLPEGAAISRLAMRLETGWQEAEVVERQAARRAYEDFLHRRQDPALLEKEAGNEFRARIFPIPARASKDIIISYSQTLEASDAVYRLPLRGLPAIDDLKVSVMLGQQAAASAKAISYRPVTMAQQGTKPTKDFELAVPADLRGLRHGSLVAARITPQIEAAQGDLEGLVILFDTSASRAPGFAGSVAHLERLVRALRSAHGDDFALSVAAFDQAVTPIFADDADEFGSEHTKALLARRALGASDFTAALRWAQGEAKRIGGGRVVALTDAIATAGPNEGDQLRATLHAARAEIERFDIILAGGIRDRELAEKLVSGLLPRDGVVLDADQPAEILAKRLGQRTVSGVGVDIAGANWVWPRQLDGIQPGDDVLVFAELGADSALAANAPLSITLTGPVGKGGRQTVEMPLAPVAGPLIERAAARALVAKLGADRDAVGDVPNAAQMREKLRRQIIDTSIQYRVLSDYTALLVLETEADYVRYGIAREALANILTVGPRGIEVLQRGQPVLLMAKKDKAVPQKAELATGDERRRDQAPTPTSGGADPPSPAPGANQARQAAAPAEMDFDDDSVDGELADGFGEAVEGGVAGGVVGGSVAARGTGHGGGGDGRGGFDPADSEPAPEPEAVAASAPPPPPPARPAPSADRAANREQARSRRASRAAPRTETAVRGRVRIAEAEEAAPENKKAAGPAPLTGQLAEVMDAIAAGQTERAAVTALRWRSEKPGDVMALIALGESLEALGRDELAARAYGSIIDLFPSRADMRRFAGARLERLSRAGAALAADSYAKAASQRPDHLTGHRLLAYAELRQGNYAKAFDAALAGLARDYPQNRFAGGKRILRDDLGLIAAAWIREDPKQRDTILSRLQSAGAELAIEPSLRFVLNWETDANDVDFHIHDGKGGHAYYSQKQLASGGELYADVTTGYGPECFTIPGKAAAYPYEIRLHYYSRGPMGYGMGKLEIIEHDGNGQLRFEQRPFVVMSDGAYVEVGQITKSLF